MENDAINRWNEDHANLLRRVGPKAPHVNEEDFGFTRETPAAPMGPEYDTGAR
jgi:hypothetical protein